MIAENKAVLLFYRKEMEQIPYNATLPFDTPKHIFGLNIEILLPITSNLTQYYLK